MKCFYHSADLDGLCSGAIVKYRHPECEMYGIDYGEEFPWSTIEKRETVYMIDYSLQPFDLMIKLNDICDLRWIDHHSSAMEEHKLRFPNVHISGIRAEGEGGCELAWEYLFSEESKETPLAVCLLSQYDVWNHKDPRVLPFQYRLRLEDLDPKSEQAMIAWKSLFEDDILVRFEGVSEIGCCEIEDLISEGRLLVRYKEKVAMDFAMKYAYRSTLEFSGRQYRIVVLNKIRASSKAFDAVYNPAIDDLMVSFGRLPPPRNLWTVSIYTTKEEVDCGAIAKYFGGGGHKNAAGFRCIVLPFIW